MRREARLRAARAWLYDFNGKDVIRSYARWFAVDWVCAIKELRLLGVPLCESRVRQLEASLENRHRQSRQAPLSTAKDGADPFEAVPAERTRIFAGSNLVPIEVVFDYDAAGFEGDDDIPF